MSTLHLDAHQVFTPLIPSMAMACLATIGIAWYLGIKERNRLQSIKWTPVDTETSPLGGELNLSENPVHRVSRTKRIFNLVLTTVLMVMLVQGKLPWRYCLWGHLQSLSLSTFQISMTKSAHCIPLIQCNRSGRSHLCCWCLYRNFVWDKDDGCDCTECDSIHSRRSWPVHASDHWLAECTFTFFLSNDAFYFGVVPILAEAAKSYGIAPEVIARASLLGQPIHQLSPLVAANYVLMGVAGVEFGAHQRFTFKWALLLVVVMIVSAAIFGVVPIL